MEPTQEIQSEALTRQELREKCRELNISWPPEPWQRVEVTGNRFKGDPEGPLLGTVLHRDGSYTEVLMDCDPKIPRNCYWDNELRPVLTQELGWVPVGLFKEHLANWTSPTALDLKLTNGRRAFNAWPKRRPPYFVSFSEIGLPHGLYTEHDVAAVRPAEK